MNFRSWLTGLGLLVQLPQAGIFHERIESRHHADDEPRVAVAKSAFEQVELQESQRCVTQQMEHAAALACRKLLLAPQQTVPQLFGGQTGKILPREVQQSAA